MHPEDLITTMARNEDEILKHNKKLYQLIKESISKDHREKLIKLLLNSVEDANMAQFNGLRD